MQCYPSTFLSPRKRTHTSAHKYVLFHLPPLSSSPFLTTSAAPQEEGFKVRAIAVHACECSCALKCVSSFPLFHFEWSRSAGGDGSDDGKIINDFSDGHNNIDTFYACLTVKHVLSSIKTSCFITFLTYPFYPLHVICLIWQSLKEVEEHVHVCVCECSPPLAAHIYILVFFSKGHFPLMMMVTMLILVMKLIPYCSENKTCTHWHVYKSPSLLSSLLSPQARHQLKNVGSIYAADHPCVRAPEFPRKVKLSASFLRDRRADEDGDDTGDESHTLPLC